MPYSSHHHILASTFSLWFAYELSPWRIVFDLPVPVLFVKDSMSRDQTTLWLEVMISSGVSLSVVHAKG